MHLQFTYKFALFTNMKLTH